MNPQYPQYPQNPQTPSYGAPQLPSQYPGYPAPDYGAQPSQYPGYQVPPMQTYPVGYGPPPARRRNPIVPIAIVAGVAFVGLIIGLVVRYNGPTTVSKSFVQNIFQFDSASAMQQVCTSSDASKLRQEVSALGVLNPTGRQVTADVSGITFTLSSESLSHAVVSYTGDVSLTGAGITTGPQNTHGTLSLDAN